MRLHRPDSDSSVERRSSVSASAMANASRPWSTSRPISTFLASRTRNTSRSRFAAPSAYCAVFSHFRSSSSSSRARCWCTGPANPASGSMRTGRSTRSCRTGPRKSKRRPYSGLSTAGSRSPSSGPPASITRSSRTRSRASTRAASKAVSIRATSSADNPSCTLTISRMPWGSS